MSSSRRNLQKRKARRERQIRWFNKNCEIVEYNENGLQVFYIERKATFVIN